MAQVRTHWPYGDGEMAGRIRSFDWASTSLGPIARWPQSLKTIVDLMLCSHGMMSLVWGPKAIHLYNDSFTELLREHRILALGRSAFETFARSRDVFEADVAAGMAGRSARLLAQRYPVLRRGQLEDAWFDVDYAPIRDETGAVAGVLWNLKETTAQHLAEQALHAKEARHRLLIESWAQAEWETDADGVVTTDSPSWRAYTGQTVEEWLDDGWLDAIHPDDRAYAERQWREAIAVRGLVDAEFRLRAPDGGWRWTNVLAAPMLDEGGAIGKWAGMNIDIDARKRAEAALRGSEQRYRFLFNAVTHGLAINQLVRDGSGRVVNARYLDLNPAYEAQTGFERGRAVGRLASEIFPSIEPFWLEMAERVVETGQAEHIERFVADTGRWFAFDMAPFEGNDQFVVLYENITDRKQAEAALRESEERQAFLLRLSDTLWRLTDPVAEVVQALGLLVEQLGLVRAAYYEIDDDQDGMALVASVETDAVTWPKRLSMSDFGADISETYRAGDTYKVDDADTDPRLTEQGREAIRDGLGIRRLAGVPLVRSGKLRVVMGIHARDPRKWRDDELRLLKEVAERTWAAVERARAEAALRESEERFAQFAASSSDALWIRDAATLAMEYTSPAIQTIYGITSDAILGDMQRWVELIVPEDRDTAIAHIEQAQAGGSVTHEFRIRRPSDGEERWICNTDFPLRNQHGRVQRIGGIAQDVTEAKRSERRLETLINELQHRARNLLGVVSAVASRTLVQGAPIAPFEERLQALSRAQGLLSQGGSDTVEVGALIRAELAAHVNASSGRVVISGPEVHLTARQVQNFALAVHELTTNAVKYGALKGETGQLAVTWTVTRDRRERRRLALSWVESGFAIEPEKVLRRGYGTELIQEALTYALEADVEYDLGRDGVRCRIELPTA